ncbi:MAG: DUF3473 domain-containing protein, partial [Calditrichaeota bacterium]|nr:DUF3473 domain-containing protein [Calditrichota bacterium]
MTIGNRRHIVTVLLHDYYHRCVFSKVIGSRQWHRLASRLEQNVEKVRKLFSEYEVKATFFTLGWVAEQRPELIARLVEDGHEIASAGFVPQDVRRLTPEAFREDLLRAREALEAAGARQILGYRCPLGWLSPADRWVLDVLIEEGYRYDASMRPSLLTVQEAKSLRRPYLYKNARGWLWELPPPTARVLGFNIPIAGGNYLRQLPRWFTLWGFQKWTFESNDPFVLYFHPWELDGDLPRINNIGFLAHLRQYRNLDRMAEQVQILLRNAQFMSVSRYLGLEPEPSAEKETQAHAEPAPRAVPVSVVRPKGKEVTLVVP